MDFVTVLVWIGEHPAAAAAAFGAAFGSVLASFGCVVMERVPTGTELGGRSRCVCGRALHPWENVPVLGWLSCAGRARCCGVRLPAELLLSEMAFGALGATCAAGPGPVWARAAVFAAAWVAWVTAGCRRRR